MTHRPAMAVEACRLHDAAACAAWDAFVHAHPAHLAFHTSTYGRFLARVVPRARPAYLVARVPGTGTIAGVLPAVVQDGEAYGPVVNALPFFGGHGAPLVAGPHAAAARTALLDAFEQLAAAAGAAATTLVTNPLDPDTAEAVLHRGGDAYDERIGQLTPLPGRGAADPPDAVPAAAADASLASITDARLLARYHQKTRNVVRRALRHGFAVSRVHDADAFDRIAAMHAENMEAIGGTAKPRSVFEAIRETFPPDTGRTLWEARLDGAVVAMLLTLHTPRVVEYFTPVVRADARPLQPLSALIHLAMRDAVHRGARWWNWGGTWTTQTGVHRFKSRWGARDLPYRYVTRIRDERLRTASPEALRRAYPYSFVLPYAELAA